MRGHTVPERAEIEFKTVRIKAFFPDLLDKKIIAVKSRRTTLLTDNIEAGVPSTIQGIIMARIDRLQDSIKEILFGASAIGREFSRPLLERVIGGKEDIQPSLTELRSLELILEKEEAPQQKEAGEVPLWRQKIAGELAFHPDLFGPVLQSELQAAGRLTFDVVERVRASAFPPLGLPV